MKLKFLKTVALKRGYYFAGTVHDIADRHAAELYVAHGDAEVVGSAPDNMRSTLGPAPKNPPPAPAAKPQASTAEETKP